MTNEPGPAGTSDWWARPRTVLPLLAVLLLCVVLLTPEPGDGRAGDARLSAHLSGALGAGALAETAHRFGWRVMLRDSLPVPAGTPGRTVHAVLAPPLAPTPAQAHRYLEAVRGGDAMLLVLREGRDPLGDSLGIRHAQSGALFRPEAADTVGCGTRPRDLLPPLWPDGRVRLYLLRWTRGRPDDARTFATLRTGARNAEQTAEAAAGFALGRGRVVVVSDPDLLRNDVLRRCGWGADVAAMRLLDWLRAGGDSPRSLLEFDEYHQGYGPRVTTASVTRRFLTGHPVGRALLQVMLAALVLLLALTPRPLAPAPLPRTERRDPLEQADALARAYQQVHATRTATQRLVRGIRSRAGHGTARGGRDADEQFLEQMASASPELAADVTLVLGAMRARGGTTSMTAIGTALRRIERTITTSLTGRA